MSLSRGSDVATNELGMEPIPFSDKARPEKKRRVVQHSVHSISWRWPVFVLLGGCLAFYIVHIIDHTLPTGVTEEEALANPKLFSGVRSRNTLRSLTSLGPRVVGTDQNRIKAPALLMEELRLAKLKAHSSQSLEYELQAGSGAYTLEYKPRFTNIYENIQNVIAKIEGTDPSYSILLNSHYDTVPTSDGATDAGVTCAVMMELVRVLTQSEVRLKHNVIFLFNGAEESFLQGSHMFLTHKWAESVRAFLNLEGAGSGGRAILFQSGPENPWLFNYYARTAPHPHGLIFGEELFQSGFIPSDSDFRIFRDFQHIPGLDIAFGRNGKVYHTIYDKEAYIPLGSHQHLGDNMLALLRELGHAPELENLNDHKEGNLVYYDYLGWFMISYSEEAGIAINVIVFLLSILSVVVFVGRLSQWQWLPQSMGKMGEIWDKTFKCKGSNNDSDYSHVDHKKGNSTLGDQGGDLKEIGNGMKPVENGSRDGELDEPTLQSEFTKNPWAAWKEMSFAFGARLMGMLSGVLGAVIMGAFIDGVATLAMPWYSNVWIVFPLFWCPCLFGYGLVPMALDWWRRRKHGLSLSMTAQLHLVAAQIPWALILIIMTGLGIRSAAIVMFPVLFSAVALLLIHLTPLYRTVHTWTWVYLVIQIPPVLFQLYVGLIIYTVFLPVMGRSSTINGDLYIAVVTAIIVLYVMNAVVPFLSLMRRPALVLGILLGCGLLMLPISLATDVGHPYKAGPEDPALQRYWIMHSDRKFYDEKEFLRRRETGYFVLNLDRNSPRTIPLGNRSISYIGGDCDDELYCGLPLYSARMVPWSRASSWIPAGAPALPTPTEFIKKERTCSSTRCTMDFQFTGPIRMTITFAPRDGVTLDSWSLPTAPVASAEWKGRPTYFLHIVRADITKDSFLSINFNVTDSSLPLMDLGLAGNYIDHDSFRTPEYQTFLEAFPDWTQMTGWISAYTAYVF